MSKEGRMEDQSSGDETLLWIAGSRLSSVQILLGEDANVALPDTASPIQPDE